MIIVRFLVLGSIGLSLASCSVDRSDDASRPARTAVSDVSTTVAAAEWRAVIEDWYVDGIFNGPHRCAAVREAIKRLPASPAGDSSVYEDLRRLERLSCAR